MNEITDLSFQAERIIRDDIISGKFAFGERLSDRALAATLGISRTPVRDALASLAKEGLVVIRAQSGSFVMTLDDEALRSLCQMRAILECGALKLAAGQDPEHLAGAVSIALAGGALAVEAKDLARAEAMDAAFHFALVEAAGNPVLTNAYRSIASKVEAIRRRLPRDLPRIREAVGQHRRIIDLAVTGRIAEAQAELESHVQIVQRVAVSVIARRS